MCFVLKTTYDSWNFITIRFCFLNFTSAMPAVAKFTQLQGKSSLQVDQERNEYHQESMREVKSYRNQILVATVDLDLVKPGSVG